MFKKLLLFISLSLLIVSCNSDNDIIAEDEALELVPPGKADNFYSDVAMEYSVSGTTEITLSSADEYLTDEEKLAKAESLAEVKVTIIMTYLNEYVIDKSEEHSNHPDFGGFHAMARAASFKYNSVEATDDPNTFKVNFSGEIGGSIEFIDFLENAEGQTPPENGKVIDFGIPVFSSTKLEDGSWKYRYDVRPSKWNPAEHSDDEVEHIYLDVIPEEIAKDAYLNYTPLFADGKLTVTIFFGYDYNDAEYDVSEAKEVYNKLVSWGFKSPVSSFEELKIDSPAFTKTVKYSNKDVTIEVNLIYDRMVDPVADALQLKETLLNAFRTKEVIMFNGHAGFSGRFLPANFMSTSRGNISQEEMWQLDLPSSYQIVLVNGCDTFGKFADNFRYNPAKHDENDNLINIDVITTTSFSWLSQWADVSLYILKALTGGYSSRISVYTWDQVLTELNWGVNSSVFFGVHGIDGDPKLHPLANPDTACNSCKYNSDCGDYYGNKCVKMLDGQKHCAMTCLDDSACPAGTTCQKVASGYTIKSKQCVPVNLQCSVPEPDENSVSIMINEVLADPAPDASGDANHDGTRSSFDDEFVELVNIGSSDVDMSGYTLSDSREVRFTFPEGTIIPAGDVILVFGGGNINSYSWSSDIHVFKADGLYLNNSGDSVFLSSADGNLIDSMTYQEEGGQNKSLTRSTDKDPDASFVPHPVVSNSAGYAQDGSSL